jgi:hypothetical protein
MTNKALNSQAKTRQQKTTRLKKVVKWKTMAHFHARLPQIDVDFMKLQALCIKMQRDKKRGVQREYITPNSILRAALWAYRLLSPGPFIHNRRFNQRNIFTEDELIRRVIVASQRRPLGTKETEKAISSHLAKLDKMMKRSPGNR